LNLLEIVGSGSRRPINYRSTGSRSTTRTEMKYTKILAQLTSGLDPGFAFYFDFKKEKLNFFRKELRYLGTVIK
jgi:hypothetical protein